MDAQVFKTLQRIASEEDAAAKAALKAETNAELAAHFSHPANASDLAELAYDVFNQTWSDVMGEDIVPKVIEVKTVGLAETDYIEEDLRGMRAYWQGKGGQIRSDVLRYERAAMPREEMVSAIDWHQDEMKVNFWGPLAKLTGQVNEKLRQLPTERLIELVRESITTTNGSYYGEFASSTLSDDQVDSVVENVADRSDGDLTIMGTRQAVRKLANVGLDFGENIKEQIFKTGQIGVYKGYPVVQVENFEDFSGKFVLPNQELWIVGRKAGRLTYYGEAAKVQTLNMPSFMQRWETAKDAGMLLYGADKGRIGRIVFT